MMTRMLNLAFLGSAVGFFLIIQLPMTARPDESAVSDAARILSVIGESTVSYRIVGIQVGRTSTARRNLFIVDRTLPRRIEIAFAFWVLEGGGKLILVDTGFVNKTMIARWDIHHYRDPVVALTNAGFRKQDVTDIILTHTHWDHIGGLLQFGDADVHITKRGAAGILKSPDVGLGKRFRRLKEKGMLHRIEKAQRVAPGVGVVPTGLHTPDFQYVVVHNSDGVYVIASDIAPLRANFRNQKVTGQTADGKKTLAVQSTMSALVRGDLTHILPGHDPAVFSSAEQNNVTVSFDVTVEEADRGSGSLTDSASVGK